ncbi:hypothetical protein EPA93_16755 [Ktedonosporobacter rubrisoli]|uniref:Uncharacterized protein n=1 Tax=Ktedonosporobacter rubrisoli TaxID=2509675 RepID=A0A4P6JQU1_KTERU|nr:hypothetical protein [Ktedonosporobacter rubrisoli]QBD77550.1 hypothetical protein EPA93_16755 [Ktedonosporobacter rubrisoli]
MSSKLFAFQLARPAESSTEPISGGYDPQKQIMVWQAGTYTQAGIQRYYCSTLIGGQPFCDTKGRGLDCFTSGNECVPQGYICDGSN